MAVPGTVRDMGIQATEVQGTEIQGTEIQGTVNPAESKFPAVPISNSMESNCRITETTQIF